MTRVAPVDVTDVRAQVQEVLIQLAVQDVPVCVLVHVLVLLHQIHIVRAVVRTAVSSVVQYLRRSHRIQAVDHHLEPHVVVVVVQRV